ncbi:hypothetical protein ACSBR1_011170 [Camellia fascicularis]
MCSNATKSFNSWVRETRNFPITRMVDSIRAKIIRQMVKRRVAAQTWIGAICSKMEFRLDNAFNKGRSWNVSQPNANLYEVHLFPSVTVDMGRHTCSCFQWQINDFPCAYAMVAIRKSGRDLNKLVKSYFHVSEYRSTYKPTIYPIPTVEQPPFNPSDYVIKPLAVKRPPGRPKKKKDTIEGRACSTNSLWPVRPYGEPQQEDMQRTNIVCLHASLAHGPNHSSTSFQTSHPNVFAPIAYYLLLLLRDIYRNLMVFYFPPNKLFTSHGLHYLSIFHLTCYIQ